MTNEEPRSSTLRTVIPTLIALLAGYGLMQMGNTLQGTLLSVRGGIEGFAAWEIGAIGAGFWLGIVFGSLRAGRLIRRVGHIRTFAALGAIASTAALLHLLMIAPPVWIMVRALTGFCFAGLFMVVESWINGAASSQTRGQILSLYGMTGLVAGICGQLLFPAADPAQFRPFCIVSCIIALALVPIALTRAAAPQEAEGEVRISLRGLYAQSPFGVVAGFLCGVTTSAFFSLGPLWAQKRGFDNEAIAFFMASGTLGGFLMTWPLGWLSDRMDRRAVIVGAAVTAAITFLVIVAFIPSDASLSAIYVCVALFGGTIIPTYSIVIAHVNDGVTPGEFVAASGGLLIVQGVGATVGPIVAGLAMSVAERGLSITIITAQLLIALWGAYRFSFRPVSPTGSKADFVVEPPVPVRAR
jgi:MFS family permease